MYLVTVVYTIFLILVLSTVYIKCKYEQSDIKNWDIIMLVRMDVECTSLTLFAISISTTPFYISFYVKPTSNKNKEITAPRDVEV